MQEAKESGNGRESSSQVGIIDASGRDFTAVHEIIESSPPPCLRLINAYALGRPIHQLEPLLLQRAANGRRVRNRQAKCACQVNWETWQRARASSGVVSIRRRAIRLLVFVQLEFRGDNTGTAFCGTIENGDSQLSLNKSGNGTFILSGPNTYNGAATIIAGTLEVDDYVNYSPVSIDSSAITIVVDGLRLIERHA